MAFLFILFILFFYNSNILAFTTHHFYRASFLSQEPRFENCGLSTLDIQIAGGTANRIFNGHGRTTKSCFCKFEHFEANFNFTYNLTSNIFVQGYVPARNSIITSFKKQNINLNLTKISTPKIITQGESSNVLQKSGLADCALLFGYTVNHINTINLDYIDASLQLGVLFPTGKRKNPNCPLDFSYGYGKHWGIPLVFDISMGTCDWITAGLHLDSIFLFSNKRDLNIKWGNVTGASLYFKADHILRGLCGTIGLTYASKDCNYIKRGNKKFPITTDDCSLNHWIYHTLNLLFEYDCSSYDSCIGPRFALLFNIPIAGRRVIKTRMAGGQVTIDMKF